MENIQSSSQIFGAYLLKRKLGAGGMASVFHAIHSETQEEVALKILHEHFSDDSYIRKRLEHEARIVMQLEHPHIVPVLGYGEADRRPYLVMPYMSGGSLAQYFAKPRTVKHETTLKLLMILASALDYAHSQEVVHRDFKLENILLGANGLPSISDFGIAQSNHTTRITVTGQILGTPQYLAPENIDNNGVLNYKADFYALGIMAYLMLTGYFPFTSLDPLSLALKHRTEQAPMASLVNHNLPTTLDAVFVRALAKNPDDRYDSAQELVQALEGAFTHAALVTTQIFINKSNPVPATQILPPLQATLPTPNWNDPRALATRELPFDDARIPLPQTELAAAAPLPANKKRPKLPFYLNFLVVFLCTGAALAVFFFNGGYDMNFVQEESTPEETVEVFQNVPREVTEEIALVETAEPIEARSIREAVRNAARSVYSPAQPNSTEASETSGGTAQAGSTRRATSTSQSPRASSTSRPSTSTTPITTATNRPVSTATSRPAATETPRPLPSNTPQPQPTNVPPTNPPAPTSVPPTNVPPTNPPLPTSVPPTNPPAPTNPPPPPPTQILEPIVDPILNPVDTLVPCIPIPLVRSC